MALPKDTLWAIEPHTEAKHKILRKYLEAWFPIMTSWNSRIVYLDGFSGPGRYTGGQPGSPVIALECAKNHRAALKGELVFLFIEQRKDRADYLDAEIEPFRAGRFKIEVRCGEFAPTLGEILDHLDREGHRIAPTFALIDPFGFSGIPYSLIRRLLANPRCEVFISFMVDSINRWLTHPGGDIRAHIEETFGTDEAFVIAMGAPDRITALKDLYYHQLTKIAEFVRYFELRDNDDRVVYYLFFASNNGTGHHKMKEAMWKVDPLGDFSFSDATNPNQRILFLNVPLDILKSNLIQGFRGAGEIPVGRVETYTFDKTGFLRKHMREVLDNLESEGLVKVALVKTNGKKRLRNTYPNDALITFL